MKKKGRDIFFSIIVPCYNVENYIEKTIVSILNQTYGNFEVIIIDDGSMDNTLKKIRKISDDKLRVVSKKNSGVSSTRNLGIEISKGDYILFVDGDDTIEEDLLENINQKIANENIEIFSFAYRRVNEFGEEIKSFKNNLYSDKKYKNREFLILFLNLIIPQSICTIAIKKEFLLRLKDFFDESLSLGEDTDFQTRILSLDENSKIYYDSKIYYNYFDRKGSAVNKKISLKNFSFLEKFSKKILIEEDKKLKKYYYQYFTVCLFHLIKEIARNGSILTKNQIKEEIKKYDFIIKKIVIFKIDKYSLLKIIFILNFDVLLLLLRKLKR